jgi:hypothetical protein
MLNQGETPSNNYTSTVDSDRLPSDLCILVLTSNVIFLLLLSHPEQNIPIDKCLMVQYAIENMSLIISVIRDS